MDRTLRIGCASGFWGDRLDAAAEMLDREPGLDFRTHLRRVGGAIET